MLKRIKQAIVTTAAAAALLFPLAVPVMVHAQSVSPTSNGTPTTSINNSLCGGVSNLNIGSTATDCNASNTTATDTANGLIKNIIDIFSAIVGIVAVIMIVVGGFKYITSGGNDSNVSGAKNTILYAVIGLVVVALAQIIVKYVLAKAIKQ